MYTAYLLEDTVPMDGDQEMIQIVVYVTEDPNDSLAPSYEKRRVRRFRAFRDDTIVRTPKACDFHRKKHVRCPPECTSRETRSEQPMEMYNSSDGEETDAYESGEDDLIPPW